MHLPIFRKLTADQRGATAIMIALMAAALIAFASLGVEVVLALQTQRTMQGAADSAALSAANAQIIGSPSPYTDEGFAIAAKALYSSGQTTACTSTSPRVYVGIPCDGPHAGNSNYVEAFIEAPFALRLAHVIFPGNFTLHGRAVAYVSPSNPDCSMAIKPGNLDGLTVDGNVTVNYVHCSLSVNANARKNGSSGTLCATDLYVGGTISNAGNQGFTTSTDCLTGTPTQCTTNTPTTSCVPGAPPALNPWADNPTPTCAAPASTGVSGLLAPGCYPSGLPSSPKSISLCPGVYVVTGDVSPAKGGGKLISVAGSTAGCPNASFAAGVTIFLTGTVSVGGNAILTLDAQTEAAIESEGYSSAVSQDYAGVLFYSTGTGSSSFGGNTAVSVSGAIVMPNQDLTFHGTPDATGQLCTVIVASTIEFKGDSKLQADCSGYNSKNIHQPAVLVE